MQIPEIDISRFQLAYYADGLGASFDRVRSVDLMEGYEEDSLWHTDSDITGGTSLRQTLNDSLLIEWTEYVGDNEWEMTGDDNIITEKTLILFLSDGDDYLSDDIIPDELEENKFIFLVINNKAVIDNYMTRAPKLFQNTDLDIIGVDINKL